MTTKIGSRQCKKQDLEKRAFFYKMDVESM